MRRAAAYAFARAVRASVSREVAPGTSRVAPLVAARHRGTRPMSSITEDQQQRLLEHYAVGLRGILAEHDDLTDPALTQKMRTLRDDAPVHLEHRFWGAQFFAMAFGHELGFAAAHPPALRAIFNLGVVAAENGLVPFQAMRSAHGQLARLGVLRCDRVDPEYNKMYNVLNGEEGGSSPGWNLATPKAATPWELFASDRIRVAAREAAVGLVARGAAVVDGALGPRLAEAASAALERHAGDSRPLFSAGQLDQTGRSDVSTRGDIISWLAGDEGADEALRLGAGIWGGHVPGSAEGLLGRCPPAVVSPGAFAQMFRSCLSDHIISEMPNDALMSSDNYVTNAMMSVYAPGAPGFVPHTDHCGKTDLRRVTAVYYPSCNGDWDGDTDGGSLVLWPRETEGDGGRRQVVSPRGDRLVVFYSDEVEHEVVGVSEGAGRERLALSFWYLKPPPGRFDPSLMSRS